MTESVGRDGVEKALWRWSGWKADQVIVDELLTVIDRYTRAEVAKAGGPSVVPSSSPLPGAQRAAEQLLADARKEAQRIVAEAAAQIPVQRSDERPAKGLKAAPWLSDTLTPYRAEDGTVWLRIGSVPTVATPSTGETKRCTKCRGVKPLARFRKDKTGRGKLRAQCMDCENTARRTREEAKRQQRGVVTKGVQG